MDDGFQILIYVAAFAVWIITTIQKSKKKQGKLPPITMPQPEPEQHREQDFGDKLREVLEQKERVSLATEKQKTALNINPYRQSIEYKERKREKAKKTIVPVSSESSSSLIDASEVDWKQAIIYSEILRPRF